MKIVEFVNKELIGWKKREIIFLSLVLFFILISSHLVKDTPIAVMSAICGIMYTIIAGKGKISCYFFGLAGSWCYVWLSLSNALWGNMLLYLCYYIPMQILGIFRWKKHLHNDTNEIIRIKLNTKQRIILLLIGFVGSIFTSGILYFCHDKSPVADGITTFLSILGMYLTVRRAIEQWIVWFIVNGISVLMWLNLFMHGAKTLSTVIMWGVYFVLAIYFYFDWRKSLYREKLLSY